MSTESPASGVRARSSESAHVVAPRGELDLLSVVDVRAALAERPEPCELVVLDLRDLTFFDTSGIRLVVETMQQLRAAGVRFAILRGSEDVQRLFAIARMEDRLPFFDALDEAIAAR
jgi:anti-sigma B factor antagonist